MPFCAFSKTISQHIWLADSLVVSNFSSVHAPVESLIIKKREKKKRRGGTHLEISVPNATLPSALCMHLLIILARCGREGLLLQMLPEQQQRAFRVF